MSDGQLRGESPATVWVNEASHMMDAVTYAAIAARLQRRSEPGMGEQLVRELRGQSGKS